MNKNEFAYRVTCLEKQQDESYVVRVLDGLHWETVLKVFGRTDAIVLTVTVTD